MQHPTSTRPLLKQHRAARPRITSRMNRREEMVKAQSPVCQPGEVAERPADSGAVTVGPVPAPDEEDRREDVQGD